MNHRYIWKRRKAMLNRGERLALAHWRNREIRPGVMIETCDLDIWFHRHIAQYCAVQSGANVKPNDMRQMQQQFWNDVFDRLVD